MWKTIRDALAFLFTASKELEQTRIEIKELRQDVTKLTHALQHLMNQIELNKQAETSEREKLALTLENELLKFERRLPAAPATKEGRKPSRSSTKKKINE